MNVPASLHTLVIGIGNPLRSDDGLGWAIAHQLSQDGAMNCDIHTVHQLTPELAQDMATARLVVMIDASLEGEPGELRMREISPATKADAAGTHHTTPEELAALTAAIYGQCPPVLVITVTGANFDVGEQLSSIVARKLPLASAKVHQLISHP
ncbi:MAG TPA: hydrogenase maturation protease [Ktedonobacteraceae bacterium]|jgi:hydrogenase maturation protease